MPIGMNGPANRGRTTAFQAASRPDQIEAQGRRHIRAFAGGTGGVCLEEQISGEAKVVLLEGGLQDPERLRSHAVQVGQLRPGDARELAQGGVTGAVQRPRRRRTDPRKRVKRRGHPRMLSGQLHDPTHAFRQDRAPSAA
jgi:hypothetical protein